MTTLILDALIQPPREVGHHLLTHSARYWAQFPLNFILQRRNNPYKEKGEGWIPMPKIQQCGNSMDSALCRRHPSVHCIVHRRSSEWDALVFDIIWLLCIFPAADLYTIFHGFVNDVTILLPRLYFSVSYFCCILSFFYVVFGLTLKTWIVIFCPLVFSSKRGYSFLRYC